MKICIIIPAHNESTRIESCLASIEAEVSASHLETEIIVVDNASTDDTTNLARAHRGVIVISEPIKGIVHARKAGYLASTGALIANVDADTIMPTGWLTKVHHEFTAHSDLVALSGPFIYYDLPLFHRAVVKTFYVFGYISHLIFRNILHTGAMLQGGNYVLRRDALEKINGYDTSISFYGEDTDIARRISKVGKVKWTFQLPMYTSGRRMQEEGIFRTGATYAINFIWETIFKKPFSTHYTDFR